MHPDQQPDNNHHPKSRKIEDYLSENLEIFKGTIEHYTEKENDPFRLFALVLVGTAIPALVAFSYFNVSPYDIGCYFALSGGALILSAMRK